MNIRLILGLLLSLVAVADPGAAPPEPWWPVAWLGAALGALAAWGVLTRLFLERRARRGRSPEELIAWHGRMQALGGLLWLGGYAAVLFVGRWHELTADWLRTSLLLPDRLLVLAPALLIVLARAWGSHLSTEVLRRLLVLQGVPQIDRPAGFLAYAAFQLRQQVLIILVPYVFVLGTRDVVVVLAGGLLGEAAELSILAAVLAVFILSPVMLRTVWPTEPVPAGPLRDRLMSVADRSGTRVAEVLLWRTGGLMVNACMAGVAYPLRYVFLSDSLVGQFHPSQVEAVFGHELAHARHHHMPLYLLVAVGGALILTLAVPAVEAAALAFGPWAAGVADWGLLGAFLVGYWGLFFGMLSRRFEGQSDIAGAGLVACPGEKDATACTIHHPDGPSDPDAICPYQAWAFTSALAQIATLSGVGLAAHRWRHGSIGSRIARISSLVGRGDAVRRYHRRLRVFKIAFALGLGLLTALVGVLVGQGWIVLT